MIHLIHDTVHGGFSIHLGWFGGQQNSYHYHEFHLVFSCKTCGKKTTLWPSPLISSKDVCFWILDIPTSNHNPFKSLPTSKASPPPNNRKTQRLTRNVASPKLVAFFWQTCQESPGNSLPKKMLKLMGDGRFSQKRAAVQWAFPNLRWMGKGGKGQIIPT